MLDRPNSRWTRATMTLLAASARAPVSGLKAASVCMFMRPMFVEPTFPESRAPPTIPTGCPAFRPIRRLKKRSTSLGRPELEGGGVLEEEGPLFGEEEREAGQVDLLVVRLHLGEVGVRGQVHGEVRGDAPLHVEPDVEAFGFAVLGADRKRVPARFAERERGDLDVPP